MLRVGTLNLKKPQTRRRTFLPAYFYCFPRNGYTYIISIYYNKYHFFRNTLGKKEEATPYLNEAYQMMKFVLGDEHSMTQKVKEYIENWDFKAEENYWYILLHFHTLVVFKSFITMF